MVVSHKSDYVSGYNPICETDSEMFLKVGVIKLEAGESYSNEDTLERAILLIEGHVSFEYDGNKVHVERRSCFDENPICLHVSEKKPFTVTAVEASELMFEGIENTQAFDSKLYNQNDTVSDVFGKDTLQNTSIRTVRTVIDNDVAPYSNLVIGEVINHPGKWSSYPPHDHVQPEVYHYRFLPDTGFGFSLIGDEASKVEHKSTSMIQSNVVHPQCSAPGYAMYYIWMIPHTPKRWLKDRRFEDKHTWLLEEDAKVWPYNQ